MQQSSYNSYFIKAFDAATNAGAVSLVALVTLLYTFFFLIQLSYFGFLMSDAQSAKLRPRGLLYAVKRSSGGTCAIRFHALKYII